MRSCLFQISLLQHNFPPNVTHILSRLRHSGLRLWLIGICPLRCVNQPDLQLSVFSPSILHDPYICLVSTSYPRSLVSAPRYAIGLDKDRLHRFCSHRPLVKRDWKIGEHHVATASHSALDSPPHRVCSITAFCVINTRCQVDTSCQC